jgi:hypothetical protein
MQVFTKAWSAALLNALGDILAQKVVDKNDKLDLKRLGIFTFLVSHPLHLPAMRYAPQHLSEHLFHPCVLCCSKRNLFGRPKSDNVLKAISI